MSKQNQDEPPIMIREVWAYNLDAEFSLIRQVVHEYPYISMDTEFPGVIYTPKVDRRFLQPSDHYRCLKANVDALKLIQLGLTLSDADGNLPLVGTNRCIWEFNFRDFDVEHDPHNRDSIDMLQRQGIDLNRNFSIGVDSWRFSELMLNSGLVFNKSVVWVTFHSAYDFGYLVKVLTRRNLPDRLEDFLGILTILFGKNVYDMKHMIRFCNALYGGLERVATTLNVSRVAGKSHQAGSDSLLTWHAFKKMMDTYFINNEAQKHAGILFGLEIAA
jgi:CCR4-NOT transcription complex subunit 7/8